MVHSYVTTMEKLTLLTLCVVATLAGQTSSFQYTLRHPPTQFLYPLQSLNPIYYRHRVVHQPRSWGAPVATPLTYFGAYPNYFFSNPIVPSEHKEPAQTLNRNEIDLANEPNALESETFVDEAVSSFREVKDLNVQEPEETVYNQNAAEQIVSEVEDPNLNIENPETSVGVEEELQPSVYVKPSIYTQFRKQDELGGYQFGYNGDLSSRSETRDHDGTVRGHYQYLDPNGVARIYHYVADNQGYRVKDMSRRVLSEGVSNPNPSYQITYNNVPILSQEPDAVVDITTKEPAVVEEVTSAVVEEVTSAVDSTTPEDVEFTTDLVEVEEF